MCDIIIVHHSQTIINGTDIVYLCALSTPVFELFKSAQQ